ncbi:MAG TPA: hypothetical protein VFA44_03090 [Gaiellaceae bacterium]|nr:hypothetical protein [Gaiellaceae bacterium]
MAAPTGSSSRRGGQRGATTRPPAPNPRAWAALVSGTIAVLAVPAGVALSWYSSAITLVQSSSSAGVALLFGVYAIVMARRGRETVQLTLGRARRERVARAGKILGVTGICVALTTGLAVGFYGLLNVFAH